MRAQGRWPQDRPRPAWPGCPAPPHQLACSLAVTLGRPVVPFVVGLGLLREENLMEAAGRQGHQGGVLGPATSSAPTGGEACVQRDDLPPGSSVGPGEAGRRRAPPSRALPTPARQDPAFLRPCRKLGHHEVLAAAHWPLWSLRGWRQRGRAGRTSARSPWGRAC